MDKKNIMRIVAVFVMALLTACGSGNDQQASVVYRDFKARITGTFPGNTLMAGDGIQGLTPQGLPFLPVMVGLLGVSPPLLNGCYSFEATSFLRSQAEGQTVTLRVQGIQDGDLFLPGTDISGRLIALVIPPGAAQSVNYEMIAQGYAAVFTGSLLSFPEQDSFVAAEGIARQQRLGFWGACSL